MIWLVLILTVIVLVIFFKKDKEIKPEPEEEICEEIELKKLAVIYNGKFLISNEIIEVPYNEKVSFKVKGFDITGTKEICLNSNQVMWLKSCAPVHWAQESGLINSVWVSNKTKNVVRNVWVKSTSGIIFKWKVMVK